MTATIFSSSAPFRLHLGAALIGASALLAMGTASAQQATAVTGADSSGSYRSEVASCMNGMTQQSKATCLEEARNAEADKRRGVLNNDGANVVADRYARCDVFTAADNHAACVARIDGEGQSTGSVAAGGVDRQVETVVVPAGDDHVIIHAQTSDPVILVPARNSTY